MAKNTTSKTAIVTGAAGGIGSEVTKRLDKLGYSLVLIDLNMDAVEALAAECESAITKVVDLSDTEQVTSLKQWIAEELDSVDVAFVNAGVIFPGDLIDSSDKAIDLQLGVNLVSTTHVIQAVAKKMHAQKSGHIIATVSMGGIISMKTSAVYSSSKFGLRALLMGLRYELAPFGVSVSGIYPSGVDTAMLRHEARSGGSALNFVNEPQTVEDIGDSFEKALRTKQLEIYPSYSDSVSSRLAASFPWSMKYLYRPLESLGERGRRKYLNKT